jgi:hypothetical protein
VERRGWFSHEATIAARYAFVRDGWPPRSWFAGPLRMAGWVRMEPEFSVAAGETFRLLLPRRLAEPRRLIAYEEIAGNPALTEHWTGVPVD